jgi:hypothetical protein
MQSPNKKVLEQSEVQADMDVLDVSPLAQRSSADGHRSDTTILSHASMFVSSKAPRIACELAPKVTR